jgi:ABC-type dipeptide/oligopeptide/nickel transport system ATPase component
VLLLAAYASQVPAGTTLDRVQHSGVLSDVLVSDYPPFGFIDGNNELAGFDVDVARAVAAKLGVKLQLATPGWETIVSGRWLGRSDICICSMSPTTERARVLDFPDYLDRVHLADHGRKYPEQLSGGEQQRVAIARTLCLTPQIMLFDEPTSALDPQMIREVLDTIVNLAQSGMTMICVTHDMGFARRVADRIVFMDRGEIVEQGAPEQLFERPRSARLQAFLSQILHGHEPQPGARQVTT